MIGPISVVVIFCLLIALVVIVLKQSRITRTKKGIMGFVLVVCLCAMGYYNYKQSQSTSITTLLESAFNDEKTLNCEGFLVHKNDFNLISQTYTLIGKANTPTSNIIISLDKCVITQPSTQSDDVFNGHTIEEIGRE